MKKRRLLFLPLLVLSVAGCGNKTDKTAILQKENAASFVYLNKEDLSDLLYHKENFILVLGEMGCSTCDLIKPVITSYMEKYDYLVYWAEMNIYQSVFADYSLKTNCYSSTVLVMENGAIQKEIPYEDNLYYSKGQFELTLQKYVTPSHIYTLNDFTEMNYQEGTTMLQKDLANEKTLDEKIASGEKITVFYSWKECKDCQDFFSSFLNDYMKDSKKKLYLYEVDYLRGKKDENGLPELSEFHEFAKTHEFGNYREGKVPSIVTYQNGKKTDMRVYLNDVITETDGTFTVTESYYPEFINQTSSDEASLRQELKEKELENIQSYLDTNL